jgi:hypothetical protein
LTGPVGLVLLALVCLVGCAPGAAPPIAAPTLTAPPVPGDTPIPTATQAPPPTATRTPLPSASIVSTGAGDGIVEGWAVLAEKDDYSDVEMSELPVDYVNVTQLRERLLGFGWLESHIRDAREFDKEDLSQALDWLASNADEDDVVLFYVAAHGSYLRDVVGWREFFPTDWAEVPSQQRVLVVDACRAGLLIDAVRVDPRPHLSIAAVGEDEYGWSGLPEEGLPIIGGVFTHYFAAAFDDSAADADSDGAISIQEAARHAEGQQRTYMHYVVFAVPEFLEMYHAIGSQPDRDSEFPHVVVDDTIGEPLILELSSQ